MAKSYILGVLQNTLSTEDFPFVIKSVIRDKNQLIDKARLKT